MNEFLKTKEELRRESINLSLRLKNAKEKNLPQSIILNIERQIVKNREVSRLIEVESYEN